MGAKRLTRTYLCNLGLVETFPKTSVAVFYAFCVSKLFFLEVGILFPANAQRCVACRKTSATLIAHRAWIWFNEPAPLYDGKVHISCSYSYNLTDREAKLCYTSFHITCLDFVWITIQRPIIIWIRAGESASSWHRRWEPSKGPVRGCIREIREQ